jgi:erythromycin esterase-like protein
VPDMTRRLHSIEPEEELITSAMALRAEAHPLTGGPDDYDAVLERIGGARVVLLGEASHGTHEFYAQRARITQRLIEERGFTAVAIEGDWPDAHRVNRYVRGAGRDGDAEEALRGFRRFPTWMWRNAEVLEFVGWLRAHNDRVHQDGPRVGFYGLDLYSLYTSIDAVLAYLDRVDPAAAVRARERYACFAPYGAEGQEYGRAVTLGVSEPCRREAVAELLELRRAAGEYLRNDGFAAEDEQLVAEENARAVADAEEYYRSMFGDPGASWNLRDRHMADTLDHLLAHLDRHVGVGRVVVWAHNSHVGDARATEMGERGDLTLGRLARERHGRDAVLVGFTTNDGSVTAATHWGGPALRRTVRPGLPESLERLLHETRMPAFTLIPASGGGARQVLDRVRVSRAIGVIYRPETERQSHYVAARPARQYDALVHIDRTRAVEPLERGAEWLEGEPPATYPTAL